MPYHLNSIFDVTFYIIGFFKYLSFTFIWYFVVINAIYTILLLLGIYQLFHRYKELKIESFTSILQSNSLPEITFIIPAYNEEAAVLTTIQNLIDLSYRHKQLIVVNDGSTDHTLEKLKQSLDLIEIPTSYEKKISTKKILGIYRSKLHPEIYLIDKENGRKFDAINAGINFCKDPYFIVVDADTYIDDHCFNSLIRPILSHPNAVAIGSTVRIKNGCALEYNRVATEGFPYNFICLMQGMEYLRSFLMRQGWNTFKGHCVIAGAFSIFPSNLIKEVGGFCDTVAEDMEIVIRLQRLMKQKKIKYDLFYLPDPVAWTEGPNNFSTLGKQRTRWQTGELESIWYHKGLLFNPRYGFFGLFILPFILIAEVFEPIIEMLGFVTVFTGWWFGFLDVQLLIFLFVISLGYSTMFTVTCLCMEELSYHSYPTFKNLLLWLFYSFVENIGYRQFTIFWRIRAFVMFIKRWNIIKKNNSYIHQIIKDCYKKTLQILPKTR
ncbi:MAG: glycosyltransferase family 2 protein [Chlamydiales bacterium]|nr:glycosyltransferase family 2 protein [Chlamydiales bacterium]